MSLRCLKSSHCFFLLVCLLCLGLTPTRCLDEYDAYDDGYGYDSAELSAYGDEDDTYSYYTDDDEAYYEYYGQYTADDEYSGYDAYYEDYAEEEVQACVMEKGAVKLTGGAPPCELKISGADAKADKSERKIDGVYNPTGCYNGRPMYSRKDSAKGQEMLLYFNSALGDWDFCPGVTPTEEILLYGGENSHSALPTFVEDWYILTQLLSSSNGSQTYEAVSLAVKCADGKNPVLPAKTTVTQKSGPVLTKEEMEDRYRYIYEKYGRRPDPNPAISFTFVILLVMIGLSIVVAMPFLMLRKKSPAKGQGKAPSTLAQIIQQGKKKTSGHDK